MKNPKIYFFYGLLIISFLFLLARLFELQIIFGNKNRGLAEGNRIKKEILPAPRGMIYDRNGKELVRNVPIYRRKARASECLDKKEECFVLIPREEALKMEARGETENLRMDIGRQYLYGEVLAHVLGYLGEANENEVKENKFKAGDLVGRMGVEEQYNELLKGKEGGEVFEVDAQGRKIRQIGKTEAIPGQDLHLSLDVDLSQRAYESLGDKPGAVVATDALNSQILVFVSSPSFDPNLFSTDFTPEKNQQIREILTSPEQPFFNRASGGVYPPGSTFKLIVATAGIQEGKIDEGTVWNDTGEIKVGEYSYKNWYFTQYGRTEGEVNVVKALKRSTDTFFYKAGEWIGPIALTKWAKNFGLGQKTGLDLPGEVSGLVPNPEVKNKSGERWYLGNTYHLAIGQGDLLTTPLQVNMMTEAIANNGRLCQPEIKNRSFDGKNIKAKCQDLKLGLTTLRLVKEGMKEVCSTGGTAYPFFDFLPQVAGKTGTAQFADKEKTHAWFTAFAPLDKPEIIVTAIIEGGGEGSAEAAPVVKKVMEAYFGQG